MTTSADDAERDIREALRAGDRRRALEVSMDAYGAAVYRYCLHLVRDAEAAADLRQNTFVQAYRDFHRFAGRSTVKCWLLGIARHRCLDLLKRPRREQPADPAVEPSDPRANPGRQVEHDDVVRALRRCLAELTQAAREAVVLRFQEDLSYPEMAELCGAQPATLQARVARALPVLRRCLARIGLAP